MSKIFEFSVIFIFVFILYEIAEASPKMNFISKFTFDISAADNLTKDKNINGLKINEALARLSYASFEIKIQLHLYNECKFYIIPRLNSVFGDEILNEDPFNRKKFITKAYWALHNEIKNLLNFVNETPHQDLLGEVPRKYFMQNGIYPLPNDGFIQLKNWLAMLQSRLSDENDNFDVELAQNLIMRNIFAHDILKPVLDELKNIMDAPPVVAVQPSDEDMDMENEQQIQNNAQHNMHPAASQSADQKHYFEEKGREKWKKFLVFILNKKTIHLQRAHAVDDWPYWSEYKELRWGRIRFEYIYMHLNAIWLLLGGIEKYVNYEPEFLAKPKKPIKIMQKENEITKDLAIKIEQMKAMAIDSFELIKLFVANLKKGGDKNLNAILSDGKKKEIEERQDDGNEILTILRDHHFINRWINPKNRMNWMALDRANLEAFADYTGQKFDRRNLGMALQRQLLTEIGALKIAQNYVANRGKQDEKMEEKAGASYLANLH